MIAPRSFRFIPAARFDALLATGFAVVSPKPVFKAAVTGTGGNYVLRMKLSGNKTNGPVPMVFYR